MFAPATFVSRAGSFRAPLRLLSQSFSSVPKPTVKPSSPEFSSGPCKKRPGYSLAALPAGPVLGRSHRSAVGKSRLKLSIDLTKKILGIPSDYLVGIVPASDTGAYEMAMWCMLGERDVDVCHWESFGKGWHGDAKSHLKLESSCGIKLREFSAPYGRLPDLSATAGGDNDLLFTFNGTTSGVRVPNTDFIKADRKGLTLCDATSSAFAMDMDWSKLDVTTFSWQKVLGGEGAHGMLVLSPRAVARLESYTPPNRPLPKVFRLAAKGKVDKALFEGATINTPSMIANEDYLDALHWAESVGGLPGLISRSKANLASLERFVAKNKWCQFLASDPATRSSTSVCLTLDLTEEQIKKFVKLLEKEQVAYDIGGYRDAPPSIRIWGGGTVETEDLDKLHPWMEWAYDQAKKA